ncbi:MAG: hypothetical protein IKE66_11780 [Hyphomicrobium sp.]|nr:hypothetical protein [Hyphomicrobium sp.]
MTQLSCASDYYAYCSKHAVGSPGVRKCMNDNGPRLSNACINALISDGEISKEEVQRRREQALAAKRPAASADAPKTAVASDVAKAVKADGLKGKATRVADGATRPAALATEPVRTAALTLTLDQKTFEALKNRGNAFVVDADDIVPTSFDDAPKSAIAATSAAPAPQVVYQDVSTEAAGEALTAATMVPSAVAAQAMMPGPAKVRPAEDPPGKMALGKKPPVDVEAPPPPVEATEPPKPSSAETWLNYMKNRFEGGMNYQGVDANF